MPHGTGARPANRGTRVASGAIWEPCPGPEVPCPPTERPGMSITPKVRIFVLIAIISMVGAACRADWSQWGGGPERTGANRLESALGPDNVSQLHHLWSVDLGGYINAAPIEAANMPVL